MSYTVNLTYFKSWSGYNGLGGKYYSSVEYKTDKVYYHDILDEIQGMINTKRLPGLCEGHSDYHVLATFPDRTSSVPHLFVAVCR